MAPEVLRHHFEYTAWASGRLLEAAAGLSPEQLTRDFGTADKSVIGTLAHVFAADRVWIGRIHGEPPARSLDPAEAELSILREKWPQVHDRWRAWVVAQTAESAAQTLIYHDLKGNLHSQPLWGRSPCTSSIMPPTIGGR